ncbi:Asx homology domain-containing protein [Talaromyces proteolyticus]|uniref:Asx homology domain-containing protein n=1 Tax=Talaromyces proteolyticus TaxID=1131652 RepID=A0AAD4KKZ4_9EURO|nr:Asx homology domain-containing protein [Talaromyces proteolyticus]KAH8695104.1 Asx homology domain-containing protein [Talaromyces proteolyticus]
MPSSPKQNAARSAKRGVWGEQYLMTNPKSALVHADLVKVFSNPKAWECLDEEEKQHLISLLPAHIHPSPDPDPDHGDAKIPPLPETFLRYDNNWRAALRNFQSDLETGRYKPEWQRLAKQAVKERAEGKFDNFKEQEFEQFWGQKQKINWGLIAGESSKVKLLTLIKDGVVRVGDVWKYSRIFSKKNDENGQTLVEKEAQIIAIDGSKMSFLVPTGQRVFLSTTTGETRKDTGLVSEDKENTTNNDETVDRESRKRKASIWNGRAPRSKVSRNAEDAEIAQALCSRHEPNSTLAATQTENSPGLDTKSFLASVVEAASTPAVSAQPLPSSDHSEFANAEISTSVQLNESTPILSPIPSALLDHPGTKADIALTAQTGDESQEKPESELSFALETEIRNISGPNALAKKILEIDGRITGPPNGNAWKEFRCYRDNQDMGSLWEVRQAWYLKSEQNTG